MPNILDRLFDSITEKLGPEPLLEIDSVPDSPDDGVFTSSQDEIADAVKDRINNSRPFPVETETTEQLEGGLRHKGIEALAFYKSRRYLNRRPYPGKWGIFYLKHGLMYVSNHIHQYYPTWQDPYVLAKGFLQQHERFHFAADVQTLMFESVQNRYLYTPTRNLFQSKLEEFVEEALANRKVLDWSRRAGVNIEDFAKDFMDLQPAAYARYGESRIELSAEWASNVLDQKANPSHSDLRFDLAPWVESFPTGLIRPSLCPEYVVYPVSLNNWIAPALVLPPVLSIRDGDEVIKRLQSKYRDLKSRWESTKKKMLENPYIPGLNFKPWRSDKSVESAYSVRIDQGNRAHLKHEGSGVWTAYVIGSHKELGHG